jgi:hypothetical protein
MLKREKLQTPACQSHEKGRESHGESYLSQEPGRSVSKRIKRVIKRIGRGVRGLSAAILTLSRPKGPGDSDRTLPEQALNVLTCLPLIVVGAKMPSRGYGRSVAFLGIAAALYHATPAKSNTKLRTWARKADYWAIAATSCQIRKEVGMQRSPLRRLLVAVIGLHSPTLTTLMNYFTVLFRMRSRAGFSIHLATLISAGFAFKFEKLPFAKNLPMAKNIAHGLWHLLAALSIQTALPFILADDPGHMIS